MTWKYQGEDRVKIDFYDLAILTRVKMYPHPPPKGILDSHWNPTIIGPESIINPSFFLRPRRGWGSPVSLVILRPLR